MHPKTMLLVTTFCVVTASNRAVNAQVVPYPRAGWQAEFNTIAHNVSGTVTIIDQDTFQVDDFTYDGGGLPGGVNFYLGTSDSHLAFTSGLLTGPNLVGTSYNGSGGPLVIDLPGAAILDSYDAISVWCVDASVNFGSGTFQDVPEPATFFLFTFGGIVLLTRPRTYPFPARRLMREHRNAVVDWQSRCR